MDTIKIHDFGALRMTSRRAQRKHEAFTVRLSRVQSINSQNRRATPKAVHEPKTTRNRREVHDSTETRNNNRFADGETAIDFINVLLFPARIIHNLAAINS